MFEIPESFVRDVDPALDLDGAVVACGEPVTHKLTLQVSEDTYAYWERGRRKRVAEAVLVIPDGEGRYLVHTKAFYPDRCYRLLTGGIKQGESLLSAVCREAHEETGHLLSPRRFLGVIWSTFEHAGSSLGFTSYLFTLDQPTETVHSLDAKEQITDYRFVAIDGLLSMADDLESLSPEWADWGRFRAAGHRLAAECLR